MFNFFIHFFFLPYSDELCITLKVIQSSAKVKVKESYNYLLIVFLFLNNRIMNEFDVFEKGFFFKFTQNWLFEII